MIESAESPWTLMIEKFKSERNKRKKLTEIKIKFEIIPKKLYIDYNQSHRRNTCIEYKKIVSTLNLIVIWLSLSPSLHLFLSLPNY